MTTPGTEPELSTETALEPEPELSTDVGDDVDQDAVDAGDQHDDDPADDDPSAPAREAAKYRRRLRETETERDGLAERLAGYQRREAERIAGDTLSRGDDLWIATDDVSAVLDDTGAVDPDKVTAAVQAVLDGRPQLGRTHGRVRPNRQQGQPSSPQPGGSWSELLKGGR